MPNRRRFLAILSSATLIGAQAGAFEIQPYSKEAAQSTIASGKTTIIEVYASWCPICQAQATAVDAMKNKPAYKDISFFRVDYEDKKMS
jgi:thiol-disulfide isomerase/thioredoxin